MRSSQQGLSYSVVMVIIVCLALIVKIVLAVGAPYFDDRMLNTQITELVQSSPKNISPSQFKQQLDQRLSLNNVRDLAVDNVVKVSNDDGLVVEKNYEVRKPFLLNIDLVLKFEKRFDQSSVQAK